MDYSIKAKDLRAMKYSCCKDIQFVIYNLIFSSVVALTCSFLCSYPFWFSSLTSSLKYFAFISLPNFWSSFLNPKFLFIVFNVIVAYLVGESKLLGNSKPSPASDIYSEYIERSRSLRRQRKHLHEEKKEEIKLEMDVSEEQLVCEDKEVVVVEHKEEQLVDNEKNLVEEYQYDEEFQEAKNDENIDDKQEENKVVEEAEPEGLPAEELNRRVEEFIARINKQRWIEARMSICGQA